MPEKTTPKLRVSTQGWGSPRFRDSIKIQQDDAVILYTRRYVNKLKTVGLEYATTVEDKAKWWSHQANFTYTRIDWPDDKCLIEVLSDWLAANHEKLMLWSYTKGRHDVSLDALMEFLFLWDDPSYVQHYRGDSILTEAPIYVPRTKKG